MESGKVSRPLRTSINEDSLRVIGIPREFISKTIDDFDTFGDEAFKATLVDYLANIEVNFDRNVGLFISGSNGQGKTFASSLILIEAYIHRFSCKRVTLHSYLKMYHNTWNAEASDYLDTFERTVMRAEYLVIDEAGKETETKYSNSIFEDLLRTREEHNLPTIICTNYSTKDFEKRYGSSVTSLVRGNTIPVKVIGSDHRLARGKLS